MFILHVTASYHQTLRVPSKKLEMVCKFSVKPFSESFRHCNMYKIFAAQAVCVFSARKSAACKHF